MPECLEWTDSIESILIFPPPRVIRIPSFVSIRLPLNIQLISIGTSPLVTIQLTDAVLPLSNASSPNSKGRMMGMTWDRWMRKQNKIKPMIITNNSQFRAMLDTSSGITCTTRINSRVPRPYRLDVQSTHLLTHLRDHYPVVGVNSAIVEQPPNIDGRVTFGNYTLDRHRTGRIEWFFPKFERIYQGNS